MHERFSDRPFSEVTLHPDRLEEPLRRKKPARIGVCFSADLFHEAVPDEFVDRVFAVMALCPQHTFVLLTKRPKRMQIFMNSMCRVPVATRPPDNIWFGTSVEDQPTADERLPWLLKTPAALRWVSLEPLIGPVERLELEGIHWAVVGGESGPKARPMHPDWARSTRAQCVAAGVPFYFKQWGEWAPGAHHKNRITRGSRTRIVSPYNGENNALAKNCAVMVHVGKRAAGRLLDGREWQEQP